MTFYLWQVLLIAYLSIGLGVTLALYMVPYNDGIRWYQKVGDFFTSLCLWPIMFRL